MHGSARGHPIRPGQRPPSRRTLRRRTSWAGVPDDRRNTQPSPVIDRRNARRADAVSATSFAIPGKTGTVQRSVLSRPWRKGTPDRLTTLRRRTSWAGVADDRPNSQPSSVIERPNPRRAAAVSDTSCAAAAVGLATCLRARLWNRARRARRWAPFGKLRAGKRPAYPARHSEQPTSRSAGNPPPTHR
jgi:hypothetical protein